MTKKEPKFSELWASQVYRILKGDKEYIAAHVRRKYADRDIEPKGPGEYVGMKQEVRYEMTTDTDPDSDTYNQRIPLEVTVYDQTGREIKQKVQSGIDWILTDEANATNLERYRKLVGAMPDPHGATQFYWMLGRHEKYQAYDVEEFFDTPMSKIRDTLIRKRLVIKGKKKKDVKESEESE